MTQSTITQAILARIDAAERAESASILYVDMTRARDYLALCGPQAPKPLSWFGALSELYALTDTPHDGEIVGEKWRARVVRQPAPSAVRVVSKDTEMLDKAELFCRIGPVAVAEARVFSVSQVLNALDGRGAGHDIEEPHAGLDEEIAILARTRGVLVHRLFELWDFAVGSTPSIPVLLDEAGLGLKRRASLEEELTRVAGQFRETPLFTRLCASRRIAREMPFTLAVEDVLIVGVIDAILDSDAILDYKTGRYREEQHRRYALQVRLYALAMKRLTGNAPRLGLIHYVDEDRTEEVPITPACLAEAEAALYEAVRLLRGVTPTLGERLPPVVA
ncbi:MAG: PD-(D/E)XK nuclease family protein [Candidatus Hydrogenedentes bacterium]|nr:PD-(D/E)XK nuclease family protein [Candidatus Hydrogenedentota bacterium]